ncbi:unnamed protein product [Rhodiola kirilowii]
MAFSGRFGGLIKQGISQNAVPNVQRPMALMLNAMRCMSSKIFVGGISYGTDDQSLIQAFSSFGEVTEARVATDRETGRSKGFAFITFAEDEAANSALSMDGQEIDGRRVGVKIATDRPPRYGGGGGGGYGGGQGGGGGDYGSF